MTPSNRPDDGPTDDAEAELPPHLEAEAREAERVMDAMIAHLEAKAAGENATDDGADGD